MAFESLSDRLQGVFDKVKGKGRLSEENMDEMLREIRLALLEADVNFKVVKEFVARVKEKAIGREVLKSLTPSQMVVKIVNEEIIELLGGEYVPLTVDFKPTIILMAGLQGAGKTTHVGKLGNFVRKKYKKNPLFVACDIYRPAAIDQLETIGKQLGITVFSKGTDVNPRQIAKEALVYAKENNHDFIIFDTAGRLHVDNSLMDELKDIKEIIKPHETLLVVDAMTGQDAVNVANTFNEQIDLTGVILTKLDGDARGGAALSIRHIAKVPIKFIGLGEKLDALSEFHPDRMANRILGMGDVLSIIEKAEESIDKDLAETTMKRMQEGKFDLEDFLAQIKQIRKLGPLENILKMLPGANKMGLNDINVDPKQLSHIEAIILSMTPDERKNPKILKHSRKQRIAKGCGRPVQEINRLINQYEQMKDMMKMFKNGKMPNMNMMKNNNKFKM